MIMHLAGYSGVVILLIMFVTDGHEKVFLRPFVWGGLWTMLISYGLGVAPLTCVALAGWQFYIGYTFKHTS